jgi:Uma2 family endonuclease
MSVELLTPLAEPEPWELEEPRRRRFSPIELEAAERADLHVSPEGWSTEQYYRLADLGILGPEERTELIHGEILTLSPQRTYHATVVSLAAKALGPAFGDNTYVRQQQPLSALPDSEPEPDIAVVGGSPEDYLEQHPREALLVLEVSDTTLRFDTGAKAELYAAMGVRDYWVADLRHRRLLVYRDPAPSSTIASGFTYLDRRSYGIDEMISPLAARDHSIRVLSLLPQKPGKKQGKKQ